ncbi:MAG: hypothetical protein PHN78_00590 [Dehalococcoidales bacterium]|nr:hypothetical protein [Dehalococcoidales bacterium]
MPGLNVIKGSDNEAGKSSLRMAITKALFQDPTTAQKDILELTSWSTDEPWEVTLEFEADGQSYRIRKSLKDKTGELVGISPSEFVATNKNTIADKIAEITGCPSEAFFESTACIGQDELIRIVPESARDKESGKKASGMIAQRLQTRLSGTEEANVSGILSKLYDKIHRKDARGPYSHLQEILERVPLLRSQKLAQEEKFNRIMESRRESNRIREELVKINRELPAKQDTFNKNIRILELQKEITRDKTQYDIFRRAKELKSKLDSLDEELKRFASFIDAEEKIDQLGNIKRTLEEKGRQKVSLEDDMKALKKQRPAFWMIFLGPLLMVGGLIGLIASPYLGIAAIAGFLLSAYWLISQRDWKKQVKSVSQKLAELESQLKNSEGETRRLLNALGCTDYTGYERQLVEYTNTIEAKKETTAKLDAILVEGDWQKFVMENADLDIQMSSRLKELEQLEPFKLAPVPLQELENKARHLQEQKEKLEHDKRAFEKFFELTDADTDQLADIDEELQNMEQEKKFWERKREIFQVTREILEEAHKQTLSKAADLLEKELSKYIAIVTDDRYNQVKINESDLSILTFSPEKRDWVDVRQLSRATEDLFYICARLALVRLITEGKRPPILLDDPFVNFHAKRLKKMMTLLQELANENQIILFTCSDAYDYLGNVISLD